VLTSSCFAISLARRPPDRQMQAQTARSASPGIAVIGITPSAVLYMPDFPCGKPKTHPKEKEAFP